MAQENIIINLTDENLIVATDVYVDSAVLDAEGMLRLHRTDNATVIVDLLPLVSEIYDDVYVLGGTYVQSTGQLLLHYSDGRADVSIDLSDMIFIEYGGTNYISSKVNYPIGHIVTIPDGSAWVAMVNPQTAQPSTDNTQWLRVGSDEEKGGIIYDGSIEYVVGDIVSLGGNGYINQLDSVGIAPSVGGNLYWIDMSLSEYYAGEHTPIPGTEYPNTTGETEGAYWVVSGLITDYTMTTGSLDGRIISNGDIFKWDGSSWLLRPGPEFIEYGGLAFDTNFLYRVGHIVGYGDDAVPHVCIKDVTLNDGSQDPENEIYWSPITSFEKGGVVWNTEMEYTIGDIVYSNGGVYYAIFENIGQEPSISPGQWTNVLSAVGAEHGGVSWISNASYQVGDVVSEGTQLYMRINNGGSGTIPPSGDEIYWKHLDTSRATAGLWQNNITYYEGNIVTWNNEIYIAPPGGIAPGIEPPDGGWIDPTMDELGGIYYSETSTYRIGDVATKLVGGYQTIYISKVGSNIGNDPEVSVDEWELVLSTAASEDAERGGTLWSTDIAYRIGDITVLYDGSNYQAYLAIADNIGISPDTEPATAWERLIAIEKGGVQWSNNSMNYKIGDIVTAPSAVYGSTTYTCLVDHISAPGNEPDGSTDWEYSATPERGGVEWLDAGVEYRSGDIVTAPHSIYGTATYTCISDHVSSSGIPPEGSGNWTSSSTPERGGILWSSENISYEVGDIVSAADQALGTAMFRCINAHNSSTGNPPSLSSDWEYGYEPEKGGLLFNEFFAYEVGQMVSVIDPSLPIPLDTELRVYTCHTAHSPDVWSAVKNNWDDVANGGTF